MEIRVFSHLHDYEATTSLGTKLKCRFYVYVVKVDATRRLKSNVQH